MTPFQEKLLEEIRYEAAKSASCTTDAEGHRAALLTIVDDLRAEVARLTAENERVRKYACPVDEHLCCGKYLGYETSCPECGATCNCPPCRAERDDPSALPAGAHPTDDWARCHEPVTLDDNGGNEDTGDIG